MIINGDEYVKATDAKKNLEGETLTTGDLLGNCFYFRTVTYHLTGMVVGVLNKNILKLKNAAWIADSGRFMDAIKSGNLDEVEPVGVAFVNLDTVTDFFPWNHELPDNQK